MARRKKGGEQSASKLHKSKESSSPPSGHFAKTISRTKLLLSIASGLLALLGYYALLGPHVSVEPDIQLDDRDPFSTQFSVINDNQLLSTTLMIPNCFTIFVETTHDVDIQGIGRDGPIIPELGPRDKTTIECPSWVGGLGAGTGEVTTAYISITMTYDQEWWPFTHKQIFPFRGVVDNKRSVHWTHITAAELQSQVTKHFTPSK